jgi:outer membrane protein insertion porin family
MGSVAVLVSGLAATASARSVDPGESGSGSQVTSVQFVAPPDIDVGAAAELVLVRPGQPLSHQALQRSIQILFETGKYANVLVYARPSEGGIGLIFKLIPKHRLSAIAFRGNQRLASEDLRQASGLAVGDEFSPDRMRSALAGIADAYRSAGYAQARIQYRVAESGAQVALTYDIEEGAPLQATRISVHGTPRLSEGQVLQHLGWQVGMVVDRSAMEASLRKLEAYYRGRQFYRARVGPVRVLPEGSVGAAIDLEVDAGPKITFSFSGGLSFRRAELLEALHYDGAEPLDDALLEVLRMRLREFYVAHGFFDAEVRLRPEGGARSARLTELFQIEERLPVRRVVVTVGGASYFPTEALEKEAGEFFAFTPEPQVFGPVAPSTVDAIGISGSPAPTEGRPPDIPRIFGPEAASAAQQYLLEKYREAGFLAVEIPTPSLEVDRPARLARVLVQIREGGQTFLQSVDFEGLEHLDEATARRAVGLHPVVPFSRSSIEAGRLALRHLYGTKGFPFAKVDAIEDLQPEAGTGDILYSIDEGPFVTVDQVVYRGARRTDERLLRKTSAVAPGKPFSSDDLVETQQRLIGLGVFDSIQIGMIDPDLPDSSKTILVSLHERKPESVIVGGGYALVEGPRVSAEYDHVNLFGEALHLQAALRLNYFPLSALALSQPSGALAIPGLPPPQALSGKDNFFGFGGRASVSLTEPRAYSLFGIGASVRTEALVDRNVRPYYAFTRAALVLSSDWRPTRSVILSLQDQVELDQIQTYSANLNQIFRFLSVADYRNLLFPEGHGLLNTLGPTVTWDRRNDPINPRRGFLLNVGGRWGNGVFHPSSQSLIGLDTSLFKGGQTPVSFISTFGKAVGYAPIGSRLTLALQAQIGRIFPLGAIFVTPTQRFFLGGPDSNRGFQQDQMLPEDVRQALHQQVALCAQTASSASCSPAAQVLKVPGNQFPSPGAEVFGNLRGELRFPLVEPLEGVVFVDAGNLWSDPNQVNLLKLRPAAGFGLRLPSPVGPATLDIGFNLDRDVAVNESLVEVQLAIVLF